MYVYAYLVGFGSYPRRDMRIINLRCIFLKDFAINFYANGAVGEMRHNVFFEKWGSNAQAMIAGWVQARAIQHVEWTPILVIQNLLSK